MNTLNFDVARIPCRDLTPYQCAVLELRKAMHDIRKLANEIRMKPFLRSHNHAEYLTGYMAGIRFSWSTILIFQTDDYHAFEWEADAYYCEAEFLLGPYSRSMEDA